MIKVRRSYICNSMFIIKKSHMCSRNSLNLFQQQFWYLPSTFWTRTCCICLFLDYFQLIKKKKKLKKIFFFNNSINFFISFSFTPHFSLLNSPNFHFSIFTDQFSYHLGLGRLAGVIFSLESCLTSIVVVTC